MLSFFKLSRKFPILTILLVTLITGVTSSQLNKLTVDTSIYSLIVKSDPEYKYFENSIKVFGSENITSILFQADDLFTPKKLALIAPIVYEIEELRNVERIDSLFTSPAPRSVDDFIHTSALFDEIPETELEAKTALNHAKENPMFLNHLITQDGKSMMVNVYAHESVKGSKAYRKFAKDIDDLLNPVRSEFTKIIQMGSPSYHRENVEMLKSDQKLFIPLSFFLIFFFLYVGTRSIHGGIIPLLTGTISAVWTLGTMAFLGIPVQILTTTVPILILIIGSTEDTHIITEYFEGLKKKLNRSFAVEYLSKKISTAILLTSITTIIGFSSIYINVIPTLKEFSLIASMGLFYNFIVTVLLVPLYLDKIGPLNIAKITHGPIENFIVRMRDLILNLVTNYRRPLWIFIILFCVLNIIPINKIQTDNNFIRQLKKGTPLRNKVEYLNKIIPGESATFIIFESEQENAFKKSHNLKKLFKVHKLINSYRDVGVAQSFAGILAHQNRVMHEGKDVFYKVPEQDNLISQYLLNFNRDQLKPLVSADYKKANIIFRYYVPSTSETLKLINELNEKIKPILKGSDITATFTSKRLLADKASRTIINSQVKGIIIIVSVIFFIISLYFRSFKMGLLAIIPNSIPMLGLFGVMGLFKIPLDFGTCNVAAIAFGIAVDDTIHFFTRFREAQLMDPQTSQVDLIYETLKKEVRPILITSFSIICGLSVLVLSNFTQLSEFGVLKAYVIFLALIADLIVTPVLLLRFFSKPNHS